MQKEKLQEIEFIGGGTQFISFTVYDRFDEPLDLVNCEVKWTLCNVGQKESPIIIKDNKLLGGIIVNQNVFTVELTPEETLYLYDGMYEQEPIIIQPNGKILRPNYGRIFIKKGSQYN